MTFGRPLGIRNEYLSTQPLLEIDLDADSLYSAHSSSDTLSLQTQTTSTVCCFIESVYEFSLACNATSDSTPTVSEPISLTLYFSLLANSTRSSDLSSMISTR